MCCSFALICIETGYSRTTAATDHHARGGGGGGERFFGIKNLFSCKKTKNSLFVDSLFVFLREKKFKKKHTICFLAFTICKFTNYKNSLFVFLHFALCGIAYVYVSCEREMGCSQMFDCVCGAAICFIVGRSLLTLQVGLFCGIAYVVHSMLYCASPFVVSVSRYAVLCFAMKHTPFRHETQTSIPIGCEILSQYIALPGTRRN